MTVGRRALRLRGGVSTVSWEKLVFGLFVFCANPLSQFVVGARHVLKFLVMPRSLRSYSFLVIWASVIVKC